MAIGKEIKKGIQKVGRAIRKAGPVLGPLGFILGGPIGGAVGSVLQAGGQISAGQKAEREQRQALEQTQHQQKLLVQAEEAKERRAQEQASLEAQFTRRRRPRGRRQTLFTGPLGLRDEFGERTVLG